MEQHFAPAPEKDPKLWANAKRRAGFKRDLVTYLAVNAFLWCLWLLSDDYDSRIPWPVWPTAGWGLAMVIQYFEAYQYPKDNTAEKEYEKLQQHNK